MEDHARQDAVYRSLAKPVMDAHSVRCRLTYGRVRASDRLAVFVGLEAYGAAGGKLLRNLFDMEAVFIDDPALLTKLAEDKLQASLTPWSEAGWG